MTSKPFNVVATGVGSGVTFEIPSGEAEADGDGRNEVVAVTRDGFLYVIDTDGRATTREWPVFRHDARNTGRYG